MSPDSAFRASMTTGVTHERRTTSSDAETPTRVEAFHCFEQTLHRLRWKLIDLSYSYHRTVTPSESGFTFQSAGHNFKLDFHEFYGLIEEAIFNLLHVFRVPVYCGTLKPKENIVSGEIYNWLSQSYRPNVLEALNESRSLHDVLGTGDVSQALRKARQLSSRWFGREDAKVLPSDMNELKWILIEIMGGLEAVCVIAENEIETPLGKGRQVKVESCRVDMMDWEK